MYVWLSRAEFRGSLIFSYLTGPIKLACGEWAAYATQSTRKYLNVVNMNLNIEYTMTHRTFVSLIPIIFI